MAGYMGSTIGFIGVTGGTGLYIALALKGFAFGSVLNGCFDAV